MCLDYEPLYKVINNPGRCTNQMNTIHWQKTLSKRVTEICKERDLHPSQCENLVRAWLSDIQKCSRPEVAGVLMDAQRELYGLAQIH